jgi:hypothetical protein
MKRKTRGRALRFCRYARRLHVPPRLDVCPHGLAGEAALFVSADSRRSRWFTLRRCSIAGFAAQLLVQVDEVKRNRSNLPATYACISTIVPP